MSYVLGFSRPHLSPPLSYFRKWSVSNLQVLKWISLPLFCSYPDFCWNHSDLRTRTFSNVRRYCTVYFKSMKFIVLMLLATEHRFITYGKCLFQNSFNGPSVHSLISGLLARHQLAAMISEHRGQGAFHRAAHRPRSESLISTFGCF